MLPLSKIEAIMYFKGENIIEFSQRFKDELTCQAYLADLKWGNGYTCTKCGCTRSSVRGSDKARQCHQCHHIESPTANTLFHKVKFGLQKAFMIVFEMSATTKGLSSSQVGRRYGVRRSTAWYFMHKVREAMKSSEIQPMQGSVQVDEFAVGGKENLKQGRSRDSKKKKVICAVELTNTQKIKRVYAMTIPDYSSKSLLPIFEKHIARNAAVRTDEWQGYKPIAKTYSIEQEPSMNGANFKQMHHVIHQIKTWLRTTFSWVHQGHMNRYLDEYCFRINRSISRNTIFHRLVERMVAAKPTSYKAIIVRT
jgi:transposase-like protein